MTARNKRTLTRWASAAIATLAILAAGGYALHGWATKPHEPVAQFADDRPAAETVIDTNVVRVIDGDTITVELTGDLAANGERDGEHIVRLLGIDAPEMNYHGDSAPECGAQAATDNLAEMLPEGESVTLRWDAQADHEDRYGRSLAYVRAASIPEADAALAQVAGGYAAPWFPNGEPQPELDGLYRDARAQAVAHNAGSVGECGASES